MALTNASRKWRHAGKKDHDANFVGPNVRGLFGHFRHPDSILFRIESSECRGITIATAFIALIASDHPEQ